jgi:hypothetical protein
LENNELEKASHFASTSQSFLEDQSLKKENIEDLFSPRYREILLARVYATQMEIKLSESQYDQAEEFGRKCLDIANKLFERDSPFIQWSLHLLALVMVKQRKYGYYGEGLFRRLEQLILPEPPSLSKKFYRFQFESMNSYASVLEHLERKNEAEIVREKLKTIGAENLLPTLHFHCLFDPTNFS